MKQGGKALEERLRALGYGQGGESATPTWQDSKAGPLKFAHTNVLDVEHLVEVHARDIEHAVSWYVSKEYARAVLGRDELWRRWPLRCAFEIVTPASPYHGAAQPLTERAKAAREHMSDARYGRTLLLPETPPIRVLEQALERGNEAANGWLEGWTETMVARARMGPPTLSMEDTWPVHPEPVFTSLRLTDDELNEANVTGASVSICLLPHDQPAFSLWGLSLLWKLEQDVVQGRLRPATALSADRAHMETVGLITRGARTVNTSQDKTEFFIRSPGSNPVQLSLDLDDTLDAAFVTALTADKRFDLLRDWTGLMTLWTQNARDDRGTCQRF